MVKQALLEAHGLVASAIATVPVKTTGDKVQDRPLAGIGGKALWTKELDRALGEGDIDFAVHSMKDVETIRPKPIMLAATLPRADVRDRLIGARTIDALPPKARIGTSSPRRASQLRALRPDLAIEMLRGNVATRLVAVDQGSIQATLLAAAGLDRLGHRDLGSAIPIEAMLPAAQQGAIGVETLATNTVIISLLNRINDRETFLCIEAERALLEALGADCHSPVAALAQISGEVLSLRAELLSADGSERVSRADHAPIDDRMALARNIGRSLLNRASPGLRALFAP